MLVHLRLIYLLLLLLTKVTEVIDFSRNTHSCTPPRLLANQGQEFGNLLVPLIFKPLLILFLVPLLTQSQECPHLDITTGGVGGGNSRL